MKPEPTCLARSWVVPVLVGVGLLGGLTGCTPERTAAVQATDSVNPTVESSAKIERERGVAPRSAELVDALIGDLLETTGLPGFSVAISDPEGGLWARGYGYADVEREVAVDSSTRFRAASVSKTITVTALAALWQAGRIDLDAPLSDYRSDFPDPEAGITARRLAGHLAGIAHYQRDDRIDRGRHYPTMETALAVFRDSPRAAPPGESYAYSTHGYTLLSALIESAGGEPFLDVLSRQVFAPLGMAHSGPDLRSSPPLGMSTFYRLSARTAQPISRPEDPSYKWAGGGLVSTPPHGDGLLERLPEASDRRPDVHQPDRRRW